MNRSRLSSEYQRTPCSERLAAVDRELIRLDLLTRSRNESVRPEFVKKPPEIQVAARERAEGHAPAHRSRRLQAVARGG